MIVLLMLIACLAESKDQNQPTEIIFEAETTEYETTHALNESTTQFSNTATQIENVTEIEVTSEDMTEMLNVSSTSTTPIIASTPKSKKSKKQKKPKIKKIRLEEGCHCDLTKNSCDVNCCCDDECDDQDRSIFTYCMNETEIWYSSNLKYCDSHQEKNHSPWFVDIFSNSLFCVLKDNLPPKIEKKYKTEITSVENIRRVSKQYFSWGVETDLVADQPDFSKNYHYGDKIWIAIDDTFQILSIPSNGLNIFCDERRNVKYLENMKSKCMSNRSDLKTHEIYKIYKNISLISTLSAFNESWKENITGCPKNVCISFEGYACDKYKCDLINSTNNEEVTNNRVITSIQYELYSNGSEGFASANIYFTHSEDAREVVEQHFEITHIWIPRNGTNRTKALSGSSGYLPGKPIIASKMVRIENATEDTLDYFANETDYPLKNYLYLPRNEDGACLLSNYSSTIVKFGENVQLKCKMKYAVDNTSNATNVCTDLQKQLLIFASGESFDNRTAKLLSATGNPTSDPNDWIELFVETPENNVSGHYERNGRILRCNNFISKYDYEFVYSLVGERRVSKLFGADLKYHTDDAVFVIDSGIVENVLSMTTRFYDVVTVQNVEYAKGPNLHLTLPNDFFYPFTYSDCKRNEPANVWGFAFLFIFIFH